MTVIPGIDQSSWFVLNRAWPLDKKQLLSTIDRLTLSITQRRVWMIVYDSDLNIRKELKTEPGTEFTTETDRDNFGGWWDPAIHKEVIKNETTVPFESQYLIYWDFKLEADMILNGNLVVL